METSQEPRLAAPGVGLPAPELFVARRLFAAKRRFGSKAKFAEQFANERSAIRALVHSVPESSRGRRILIPRLRGLEDSSRYWSVWMTLDHLRITNDAFALVIATLVSGRVPPGKADTAAVKPSPESGAEVEPAFEASCDLLAETVRGVADLKTPDRFEHPWFGPLDAEGWHALSATHLGIHRAQIEAIRKRL